MICWLKDALSGIFFARRLHLSSKEQKKPTQLDLLDTSPLAERPSRGLYQPSINKGKGSHKSNFKGRDKSLSDWPPLSRGPPKGFPKDIQKGLSKSSDKGKFWGKEVLFPSVGAPAANFSPPDPPYSSCFQSFLFTSCLHQFYFLFISLPAVSLGILSDSQHGSSTMWFLSLLFGYSLSFRV